MEQQAVSIRYDYPTHCPQLAIFMDDGSTIVHNLRPAQLIILINELSNVIWTQYDLTPRDK